MHAAMVNVGGPADFCAQRSAIGSVVHHLRSAKFAPYAHAGRSPARRIAISQSYFASFLLIAIEQSLTAPARHRSSELPGQVDGIVNPRMHAEAAGRDHQVNGIAGKKNAAVTKAVGNQ